MSLASRMDRAQGWNRRLMVAAGASLLAILSATFGIALTAVAHLFGEIAPLVILLLPVGAAFAVGVLADTRLGIAFIYASFPLGFAALGIGPFDLQAVDAAVLVAVALVALRRLTDRATPLSFHPVLGWGLALALWAVIALPSASDQAEALKQTGALTAGVVVTTLAYTVAPTARDVRALLWWFAALSALVVLPALANAGEFRAYYGGALVEGRLQGIFVDPNELGSFCSVAALVTVGLGLSARSKGERVASGALLTILVVGLLLSLSRGAWLGALVGALLLMVALESARKLVAAVSIPLVAIFFVINTLVPNNPQVQVVGQRVSAFTNLQQPYDERPDIWAEAIRQIQADPLTGSGPGNFGEESRRLASSGVSVYASHAHNVYLNIAAELGLPALVFFLGLLASVALTVRRGLIRYRRASAWQERTLVAAIGAALLSLVVQGTTNNFLGNAVIDATLWSLVGLCLALVSERPRGSRS